MRKFATVLAALLALSLACSNLNGIPATVPPVSPSATPLPGLTLTPSTAPASTPTSGLPAAQEATPTPEATLPPEGYGPTGFPDDISPLTGLKVADPALLARRPVLVKVTNLPRNNRPQWGLTRADVVYEYYTEEGSTRFAAVFLGNDAEQVGPIRSARLFDVHLVRMYKANFAFGSADKRVLDKLFNSEFEPRLIFEWTAKCPAMCRFEPNAANYLVGNTKELTSYINSKALKDGNGRQNLDGNVFKEQVPEGGQPTSQVFVRYSGAIYNRWDYDAATGKYLRYSDTDNAMDIASEKYAQLTDRLTGQPVAVDNLVVLYVTHSYYSVRPEIIDIVLSGPGKAYVFRDGQKFDLQWTRNSLTSIPTLYYADGRPFPLNPGQTWYEIVGSTSTLVQAGDAWRFQFSIP